MKGCPVLLIYCSPSIQNRVGRWIHYFGISCEPQPFRYLPGTWHVSSNFIYPIESLSKRMMELPTHSNLNSSPHLFFCLFLLGSASCAFPLVRTLSSFASISLVSTASSSASLPFSSPPWITFNTARSLLDLI